MDSHFWKQTFVNVLSLLAAILLYMAKKENDTEIPDHIGGQSHERE